jgi:nitroreductase/NAD-dependent dihydropyrimidine dehydrogenase PreA subunit
LERLRTEHTETERVILRRRSVRNFKKEQVPAWMAKRILEAARFSPSAGNAQSWKFVVLRDPQMIDEMTADAKAYATKMYHRFDYLRKGHGWRSFFTKLMMRRNPNTMHPIPFGVTCAMAIGAVDLFHGAPMVVLIFKDVRGIMSPELDCGILGQNMVLAAHSLGLGTCWVSFSKYAFGRGSKWKQRLGIEYPYELATSIAVGFPLGDPDGLVPRPLHPVDWYEGGKRQTIWDQGALSALPAEERRKVPDFRDPTCFDFGLVRVDEEKCTGCGLCTKACIARRMILVDKVARVNPMAGCSACSACMAICPAGALTTVKDMRITGMFTFVERGDLVPPRLFEDE